MTALKGMKNLFAKKEQNLPGHTLTHSIWAGRRGFADVYDLTNCNPDRRQLLHQTYVKNSIQIMFIELLFDDMSIIMSHISQVKGFSPDYVGVDPFKAFQHFIEMYWHLLRNFLKSSSPLFINHRVSVQFIRLTHPPWTSVLVWGPFSIHVTCAHNAIDQIGGVDHRVDSLMDIILKRLNRFMVTFPKTRWGQCQFKVFRWRVLPDIVQKLESFVDLDTMPSRDSFTRRFWIRHPRSVPTSTFLSIVLSNWRRKHMGVWRIGKSIL